MTRTAPTWLFAAAIASFAGVAVYATALTLNVRDLRTGIVYRDASLEEYHEALQGTRAFPYQWRFAAVYLVRAGERLGARDPHAVDLGLKTAFLIAASFALFAFARRYATDSGALAAVAIFLLTTIAGFSDGYSIYYTNDYIMLAAWFAAVECLRSKRIAAAVLVTALGSFAKETMVLVPILAMLRAKRHDIGAGSAVALAAAFLVPTVVLRTAYPAPLAKWAWWHMLFANVPFLQHGARETLETLKNNAKVLLFFNVFWIVAARAIARTRDSYLRDLGVTAVAYLLLAYPVIVLRELRHFLPLAIVVLPAAIGSLEAGSPPSEESV